MGYVESLLAGNEEIVISTRQHWVVLAKSILINVVFLIVICVLALAVSAALQRPLGIWLTLLAIIPVGGFSRDYLDWWNEVYLVTNRRVIQAEGIINKHVIDSSLEKVNDVVLDQSFFGRLLDYGDIEILTASEGGVNRLDKITAPVKFKTEMLNQKEALGSGEHFGSHRFDSPVGRRDDIPALIAELDELCKRGVLTEAEFQMKKAQLLSRMG